MNTADCKNGRRAQGILLVVFIFVWLSPTTVVPAPKNTLPPARVQTTSIQESEEISAPLKAIIVSARLQDIRWSTFSDYRTLVNNFYRPSGYTPAWITQGAPTAQALEIIQLLQEADKKGLRAEDYDASRWSARLARMLAAHTADDEARFDAAVTVCLMRYISDLRIGRINPRRVKFEYDVSSKKLDLPRFVREHFVNGTDLAAEVDKIEPPVAGYKRLRAALAQYLELAKKDDGTKLLDPIREVRPGGWYSDTPRLAKRLRWLGDLSENAAVPPNSNTYDGALVEAVKHFQGRHGLRQTGYLNSDTIREMNVPLNNRLEQIRLTLERYRWLSYTFTQPEVVINIPEFQLRGFAEGFHLELMTKVNVGDAFDAQTPVFGDHIRSIIFRPYWNPPPHILRNEIIPQLKVNDDLEALNLELVTAGGQVIKKGHLTPELLQQLRAGKVTVLQPPGPENSMGLVKFIFPNAHSIYLHDTPRSYNAFSEEERTFSHGCIHVQEPGKLAAWLLRKTKGWDLRRVEHAMHEGPDSVTVNLIPPVPLMIVYATAIVAENGDIHFFDDIYELDASLKQALAKGYPYPQ
jgi:murein L,D-transpeptidase YcbB/YkuD